MIEYLPDFLFQRTTTIFHAILIILFDAKMMDPKIVFMLFVVEVSALIFTLSHLRAPEIQLHNAYNQGPVIYSKSRPPQLYYCFAHVNQCVYNEHLHLFPLHILHLIFISITIFCYICVLIILNYGWEEYKMPSDRCYGIKFYRMFQMIIILCLFANTIFLGMSYWQDDLQIHACNEVGRLVRIENMVTYIIINVLETVYNIVDMLAHKDHSSKDHVKRTNRLYSTEINLVEENDSNIRVDRRSYGATASCEAITNPET
jgi:hypothetical protein